MPGRVLVVDDDRTTADGLALAPRLLGASGPASRGSSASCPRRRCPTRRSIPSASGS